MSDGRKSIFVTGAASGLGREVSRYFADRGWFIGLADVNEAGLKETADMLPAGQWSIHRLDVTDRPQWKAVLADLSHALAAALTCCSTTPALVRVVRSRR